MTFHFHGVMCCQEVYWDWKHTVDWESKCPWCKKSLSHKYNNTNRHLKSCKQRPLQFTVEFPITALPVSQ